jgi:predicted lipoprotein with Yx(FWY)xxD motif
MKRNVRVAVAALIGVIALAACGSSSGSKSSGNGEADTTSTTAASATSSTTAPGAKDTLQLVDTSLGKVVAGADGKVLYLYTPDGTAEVSTVPAAVLQAWPPVVVKTAPTVGTGLDKSKVSTGTQPSGAKWVRYNGHLLYGFTGDASPGDINGNGLGGVWHAVNPSGDAIMS